MGPCWNGFGLGGFGHMGAFGHMGGWGPIAGVILFLGLLGALAVLAVLAVLLLRRSNRGPLASSAGAGPLDAARQRLAAGEITTAEFDNIRERLRGGE
jgi:uncharacterized membrane protein